MDLAVAVDHEEVVVDLVAAADQEVGAHAVDPPRQLTRKGELEFSVTRKMKVQQTFPVRYLIG